MLAGSEGSVSGVRHYQQILHAPIVSDADCELLVLPTGGAVLSSKSIELGCVSLETKPEHRDERAPPHCAAQDFFSFPQTTNTRQEDRRNKHCTGIFNVYDHVYSLFGSAYVYSDFFFLPKPLYHTTF